MTKNRMAQGLKAHTEGTNNTTRTENGAITNRSTKSAVLDFFYHAAARRGKDNTKLFADAYRENAQLAVIAAFYTRDVRGGQGERSTFRQVLNWLYTYDKAMFKRVLPFVPTYGRWDDVLEFTGSDLVVRMVRNQINQDLGAKNPSLLAKWMPSENTSSVKTRNLASKWRILLNFTPRQYRVILSTLRRKINVTEVHMSKKEFAAIDYSMVPSQASYKYRKAFAKRDFERYSAFLASVKKGTAKINAATLYPYQIVGKYLDRSDYTHNDADETLEALWKALPDYCEGKSFITVCDTSGSMFSRITPKAPQAIDVAISLALYSAERNKSAFKDLWINFSDNATVQKIRGNTLYEKVSNISKAQWAMSTNLQAVFDLVLNIAIKNKIDQSDMPQMVMIVSDMEFNACVGGRNIDAIKRKFASAGYTMPMLAFWNVASRNDQTPVTMSEDGTMLVSGCSPSIFKNALNAKATTPYELMLEVLNSDRYAELASALW